MVKTDVEMNVEMNETYESCLAIINNNKAIAITLLVDKYFEKIAHDFRETFQEIEILEAPYNDVLNQLFIDGVFNWGRVLIALYWARLYNTDSRIVTATAAMITPWIHANGGFKELEANPTNSKSYIERIYSWLKLILY